MSRKERNWLDVVLKCENNGDHACSQCNCFNVNKNCGREEEEGGVEIISFQYFDFFSISLDESVCSVKNNALKIKILS